MSTATGQIQKTQFHNNTGGHLGVVIIDPKGADRGVNVEPDGHVWLSEAEQRLTANAPRRAEDNPFIEQTKTRRSPDTGELEEYTVVPLTVASENRYVPADLRPIPGYVPTPVALQHAQAAATGDESVTVTAVEAPALQREHEMQDAPPTIRPNEPVVPPTPPPRAAAAAEAARAAQESAEEPTVTEETAQTVQGGETVPTAPQESIGAAEPPSAPAPEGSYAGNEEVGTPTAATAETPTTETTQPGGNDPAPWNG